MVVAGSGITGIKGMVAGKGVVVVAGWRILDRIWTEMDLDGKRPGLTTNT